MWQKWQFKEKTTLIENKYNIVKQKKTLKSKFHKSTVENKNKNTIGVWHNIFWVTANPLK